MENTKENIKKVFKETKGYIKNEFIVGIEKYFKKNKMLSDKQFDCLINWYKENQNKDDKTDYLHSNDCGDANEY